ncbi:glycosyltransferase family 4 protein [Lebetimonas sp. JS170]|uniref:glycosyltransferase family 4 protein n=1 Tax=Lebetimonas sp. JS170 TaxID=990073 RepID=UPI00046300F0|nr:glycosyltransferase family 4 protein [Lebetimonas sp. JS170]
MKFCMYNITTTIKTGGIETFYWEVAKELIRQGHEVEIISGKGDYIKYVEIPLKMFDFIPRDKIIDLGNRFRKWWERVSFFRNAYSYLKNKKYDIFLIHKPLDFFTCYFMKKINPEIKTVFVSGGEDFYGFDKFFSKYVDYMFAVSKSNKKIIENRYKRKVKVLYNGVDIELFKADKQIRNDMRKKFNLENKKILLSVGRIVGLKGFHLAIEILPELPENFIYVLIGKGKELENLKKLAKKLNVENKVLFLGEIENKELYKYINIADIFIQPSIGKEAFGITLIEAMACGVPVIASNNGGMKEIVKNGENGFLFDIDNKEELKEKILKAMNMTFNTREYVKNNFTWENTVDNLLKGIGVEK